MQGFFICTALVLLFRVCIETLIFDSEHRTMKKLLYLFLALTVACTDDDGNPCTYDSTLTTSEATNITDTSATLNGTVNVVSQNCDDPNNTEQGFVISTEIQPTINDTQINVNGTDISTTIEGLEPNTTYNVRSFLTNFLGEFYGNEVSFTTSTRYRFEMDFFGCTGNDLWCNEFTAGYWYYSGDYSFDSSTPVFFQGESSTCFTYITEAEQSCEENLEINVVAGGIQSDFNGMYAIVNLYIYDLSTGEQVINEELEPLYICPDQSVTTHYINFNPQDNTLTVITN